jgi:hypothetical protein
MNPALLADTAKQTINFARNEIQNSRGKFSIRRLMMINNQRRLSFGLRPDINAAPIDDKAYPAADQIYTLTVGEAAPRCQANAGG